MALVVIQTTIPGTGCQPFRITEVLEKVAESADEALEVAAWHIGGDREVTEELLTARWHETGRYWLVAYEPAPEAKVGERILVM